jgi:hypothetical protein
VLTSVVVRSAAVPSVRALARTPVFWLAALGVAPLLVTVARGGDELTMAVVTAAVVGGACAGGAVEDAAARTLAASPTTRLVRRLVRLAVIAGAVLMAWAVAALGAGASDAPIGPLGPRAAEAAAAAGVSVLIASIHGPNGEVGAGLSGAGGAVLVMLTSTTMAMRYSWLPMLGDSQDPDEWWLVALAAWVVAGWLNRDPAARGVAARPRSAPIPAP